MLGLEIISFLHPCYSRQAELLRQIDFALLCHLLYVMVNATTAETDQSSQVGEPNVFGVLAQRFWEFCHV